MPLPSQPKNLTAHWSVVNTKLYCLVAETHVCEQLAQGRYMKVERSGYEPATSGLRVQRPNHYTTMTRCAVITAMWWTLSLIRSFCLQLWLQWAHKHPLQPHPYICVSSFHYHSVSKTSYCTGNWSPHTITKSSGGVKPATHWSLLLVFAAETGMHHSPYRQSSNSHRRRRPSSVSCFHCSLDSFV